MNWRWFIFDYADPELPLGLWKRVRLAFRTVPVWKLPKGARLGRFFFAIGLVAPLLVKSILVVWLIQSELLSISVIGSWLMPLTIVITVLIWPWGCLVYGWTCRREQRYRIRLEGYNICMNCGYWLRGLDDSIEKCPECGAKREPMPQDQPAEDEPA